MTEALKQLSWPTVVVVLGLAGAAIGAVALGATELAYTIGGGAVGYLGRGRTK